MSNDGAEAGESVPSPTRTPAARSAASGATPQPSSAFERGQWATGHVALGEQGDLVVVDLDAVRAQEVGPEHRLERRDRALARSAGRAAARSPAAARCRARATRSRSRLSARCVPTGMPSDEAPAVDVDRAGVRRVRRDADPDERRSPSTRARFSANCCSAAAGSTREHLEVDDRAQAELGGRGRRGAREAVVGGRRDPRARASRARPGGRARACRRRRAGSCARRASRSTGRTAGRRRSRRTPSTRGASGR